MQVSIHHHASMHFKLTHAPNITQAIRVECSSQG